MRFAFYNSLSSAEIKTIRTHTHRFFRHTRIVNGNNKTQTICRRQLAAHYETLWSLILWESAAAADPFSCSQNKPFAKARKIHAYATRAHLHPSSKSSGVRWEKNTEASNLMHCRPIHLHHTDACDALDHPADHIFIISHHVSLRLITSTADAINFYSLSLVQIDSEIWSPNWERRSWNWFCCEWCKLILLHSHRD